MIFRDIIRLVVQQNEKKASKEEPAVLETLIATFSKDQTLLLATAYHLYDKGRDEIPKFRHELLNGLLVYPEISLGIYNALLAPDDEPKIEIEVTGLNDVKEIKTEINRFNLLETFLGLENFRRGLETLNSQSDSILHLLVRKDRPHTKVMGLLLGYLPGITNLPNKNGNPPYLDSVIYKKQWAIASFNLSTAAVIKDAKNLKGEDARALAGNDESLQLLISRIPLEPIGLLSPRQSGPGFLYDSYPSLFPASGDHLSVCSSSSSNSFTSSLSASFSSSTSSFTSSPLNSQRSNEPDSELPSARSDMSCDSSAEIVYEAESEPVKELYSWMKNDPATIYQEFERLLQTDKAAIGKSLQEFFNKVEVKDKSKLFSDLFVLFDKHNYAVEYFNELRLCAQKQYDKLQKINNDAMLNMMFQLVTQLKAHDASKELTSTAYHLMLKRMSGEKLSPTEIKRQMHLREALFILTSKGNKSTNWQDEFDIILSRVTGLQALYSQSEILDGLNAMYSKFDNRQIFAAYLILFQLIVYNPNDFFINGPLVEKAKNLIDRGFEKGAKPSFAQKRIRRLLGNLIAANQKFYTDPLVEHFDSLNQWFEQRESTKSFDELVTRGIKQKERLILKSKLRCVDTRQEQSACEKTAELIAQEMRVCMVSYYKQVPLQTLYNYKPPKEGESPSPESIEVSRKISEFNTLTHYFLKKIFDNPDKMLPSLELLFSVGRALCSLGGEKYPDLNHLMAILGVYSNEHVSRLTRHFDALSDESSKIMSEISKITDRRAGFAEMTNVANEYKTTLFFLGRIMTRLSASKEVPKETEPDSVFPHKGDGNKLLEHCEVIGKVLLPILKLKLLVRFYPQISQTNFRQSILASSFDVDAAALDELSHELEHLKDKPVTLKARGSLISFLNQLDKYLRLSYVPNIKSAGKKIKIPEIRDFLVKWFNEKIESMENELGSKPASITQLVEDAKTLHSLLVQILERLRKVILIYYKDSSSVSFLGKRYNPIVQTYKIKNKLDRFIAKTREYLEPDAISSGSSVSGSALTRNLVGEETVSNTDSPRENTGSETQRASRRNSGFFRMRLKKESTILPPPEYGDSADTLVFEQS